MAATRESALAMIEAMSPEDRKQVSPDWVAKIQNPAANHWTLGFSVHRNTDDLPIGNAGFKGPPSPQGMVELAYGINPEHQNQGYATETAQALTAFALQQPGIRVVRAHTLPERNASSRVLTKCGFKHLGEAIDPEDGLVWRWEKLKT